ncbi:hypothetical protein GI374_10085 [Paracoccus sp. S-4012]|nr:hypothetical protein [Paracoccus sp. S-4012]
MLIFLDQRLVFLATPKAGSTAVEVALESLASLAIERPPALKHTSAAAFERHIRPWLEAAAPGEPFTTVALMREPIDWLRSWYRFRQQDDLDDPDHPLAGMPFHDFATDCIAVEPPDHARIGRQAEFLTGGGARAARIFRYEEMDRFTHFLEQRLDCAVSLPRVNVPPRRDTSVTPELEARLREALAVDVALYASL